KAISTGTSPISTSFCFCGSCGSNAISVALPFTGSRVRRQQYVTARREQRLSLDGVRRRLLVVHLEHERVDCAVPLVGLRLRHEVHVLQEGRDLQSCMNFASAKVLPVRPSTLTRGRELPSAVAPWVTF